MQRVNEETDEKAPEPQVFKIHPTDADDQLNRQNKATKGFFDLLQAANPSKEYRLAPKR